MLSIHNITQSTVNLSGELDSFTVTFGSHTTAESSLYDGSGSLFTSAHSPVPPLSQSHYSYPCSNLKRHIIILT